MENQPPDALHAAGSASADCPHVFVDGPIDGVEIRPLELHADARGWLIELFRQDELAPANRPAMAYVSQTEPGACRGPHEHTEQSDRFAFVGPGELTLYLWDVRPGAPTRGHRMKMIVGQSNRQTVLVPPGVVHAYKNVGARPAWVINLPDRLYAGPGRRERVDEIRHEELGQTVFRME